MELNRDMVREILLGIEDNHSAMPGRVREKFPEATGQDIEDAVNLLINGGLVHRETIRDGIELYTTTRLRLTSKGQALLAKIRNR